MAALLKDLYNKEYITLLSKNLEKNHKSFNGEKFQKDIFNSSFKELELKERMRHISTTLKQHLPENYEESIRVLKAVFLQQNHAFSLENMIFQDYVEVFGLNEYETSMDALEHFTKNSSSEFAIRRFIIKYPEQSMKQMKLWSASIDAEVRRLASEGCRPRLPWAIALPDFKNNPTKVLEILEILKDDESEYVRKSVANNINDISKDNPEIVKNLAKNWIGENKKRDALLKHGCRTLLKQSDVEILELFGFSKAKNLKLKNFTMSKELKMDEELEFSFELNSEETLGKLRVEFVMHFLRKNSQHNKKVFKLSEGTYETKSKSFSKKYSFKPISTRVYYKGLQKVSILVNGETLIEKEFMLF